MLERDVPRDEPGSGPREPLPPIPREVEFGRANEDGSVTTVVSYERHVDPLDRGDMAMLREFRLRAAAAGLREAFSPLVMPTFGMAGPNETVARTGPYYLSRPLTVVQLGYEKPQAGPAEPAVAKRL